jgi:predicted nicotinamide N-methyase
MTRRNEQHLDPSAAGPQIVVFSPSRNQLDEIDLTLSPIHDMPIQSTPLAAARDGSGEF